MKSLLFKVILGLTTSLVFQLGTVASDLGSYKASDIDLNTIIDSVDKESKRTSKKISLTINKKRRLKMNDQELQNLVSDELMWDTKSEARIHRVPQSIQEDVVDSNNFKVSEYMIDTQM